ncbi:MAG: malate dehydrogenase [Bacteroidales bacterium]|jgi:malate dehydrogenase|nr:malate dehydrogenase [Bacteroidales bacterium]MBO5719107.1 malate dehydrogenase [Bacteroidales bacterium]MBO5769025.1 malate dehydrogenase [Bacteroidales bacterium]MBO5818258.1 malate dehydrogenase [Bacteroidales bacterium]MBO5835844.1 malate dehydrogenase [Bacteroidales bacterium]
MSKVTVIGVGNVGATAANVLACREIADEVVLLDIKEGLPEGKALDMKQASCLLTMDTKLYGVTNDYSKTANSDVVVVTSGVPRKPGMTREELIGVNAGIVKSVVANVLEYSPNAILVMVSNPLDTMTYLTVKSTGLDRHRIIGMGGALDSSRFKTYLSEALNGANLNDIEATVIGGHGDTTMIPLTRLATYKGVPVSQFLDKETLDKVAADTMVGGATLTKMLGTSAWYAPGAAAAFVVESILHDQKRIVPCCVYLEGEYGQNDICIGVPVRLGRNGWEEVIDFKLNEEENALFEKSAEAVRKTNAVLETL